jgi:hypothetical protein
MNIKTKFPHDNRSYIVARLSFLSVLFILLFYGTLWIDIQFQISRASLFPLSRHNITYASDQHRCDIPYDNCRCSVISNKPNESIKCITDLVAITGHLLPLVSYALQIYGISTLFSFTGYYSQLLTDIFWVIALFVFVIIAIGAHGSSCLHFYTSFIIVAIGLLMAGFLMFLVKRSHHHNSSKKSNSTSRHKRVLVTNNQERETTITITVS